MIELISYSPDNESFNEETSFYRCHKKDALKISKLKYGDVFRVKCILDYENRDNYEMYEFEYGGKIERDGRYEGNFESWEMGWSIRYGKYVPIREKVKVNNMRKI